MNEILENIRILAPFLIIPWGWLIIRTIRKPQSYFNSILLMCCCFFTLIFVAGLFGSHMGEALLLLFLLVMILLFLVPVMLVVNGIQMIRKESFSFSHILSLLLGITIGAGELATIWGVVRSVSVDYFTHIDRLAVFLSSSVFYWSCLLLSFVVYCIFISILPYRCDFDYIIIHGCGLAEGRRMTRLLANRIDKAIRVFEKCRVKPYIIASGGKGSDEQISEAQAMEEYLLEHGIREEYIIKEDQSATTMENLVNSQKIINSGRRGHRTALVSSNYHIYRCLTYAKTL